MTSAGRHAGRPELLPSELRPRRTHRTPDEMTDRAWRLVGLHLVIPGSAQMVAGSRLLGRIAIGVWVAALAAVAAVLLLWLAAPTLVVGFVTGATGLTALQTGLVAIAVGWVLLTLDTLRLVRLPRLRALARPLVALSLVVAAAAGGGVAGYGAYLAGVARGAIVTVFPQAAHDGGTVAAAAGRYDVMIVGMDRPKAGAALQPESVSVASIDGTTGRVTVIALPVSIDRVPFPSSSPMHRLYPDGYRDCIAAPCTLGDVYTEAQTVGRSLYPAADGLSPGMAALRDAVTGATGRPIRYSVQIDTSAFGQLVDALGGVRIGATTLNGAAAVRYLRGAADTHGVGGAQRTLRLETALLQQVDPANALLHFQAVASASSGALRTDIPQSTVADLAVLALKSQGKPIVQLSLTPPTVADLHDPDWRAVHRLVADAIG